MVIVARDYFDAGVEAGLIAARVLRGESVADIPFQPATKLRFILNPGVARRFGITFPPDLIARATNIETVMEAGQMNGGLEVAGIPIFGLLDTRVAKMLVHSEVNRVDHLLVHKRAEQ